MAEFTDDDDALLEELGVEVETKKDASRTPREERIIAGFEEIQHFVEQHGRAPQHGALRWWLGTGQVEGRHAVSDLRYRHGLIV